MNQDFIDILRAFLDADVDFMVVGAHALALHSRPRATGDIDIFVRASIENARKDLVDVSLLQNS